MLSMLLKQKENQKYLRVMEHLTRSDNQFFYTSMVSIFHVNPNGFEAMSMNQI